MVNELCIPMYAVQASRENCEGTGLVHEMYPHPHIPLFLHREGEGVLVKTRQTLIAPKQMLWCCMGIGEYRIELRQAKPTRQFFEF